MYKLLPLEFHHHASLAQNCCDGKWGSALLAPPSPSPFAKTSPNEVSQTWAGTTGNQFLFFWVDFSWLVVWSIHFIATSQKELEEQAAETGRTFWQYQTINYCFWKLWQQLGGFPNTSVPDLAGIVLVGIKSEMLEICFRKQDQ